jgi:hypothetical protein
LGEIKLDSKEADAVKFKTGSQVVATRLVANTIKMQFALKTAAERAMPNAFLHELISKIPDTDDSKLTLKKQDFEDDLFESEMNGTPPPWDESKLINSIAVALARASPTAKEVSAAEHPAASPGLQPPATPSPTPNYQCTNCGDKGVHFAKDCPKKCKDCGFNFCPGVRFELCAVLADEPPSKRSLKTFGEKRDLFPHLVDKLDKAWEIKHSKKVAEVSSLEMHCVGCSDDEEDHDAGFGLARF